ncbi:hypothetical protein CDL12_24230 [Handroanthus impetiginosus]|uniref:WD40 repeat protein n=1 Tax=Handroanthus impetiginosus TaxID=429701 RepID=A0A2G9GD76_9LAMI|nr:hypothetical protein CDL12_24230 [Handroanthus impetiginosus]
MTEYKEMNDDSRLKIQQKVKLNSKPQGLLELFTCYVHPMPISMVQLIVKDNEIFVSVKCGYSEHKESTLFVYKALKNGEKMGCPSLIGHVPIALQISKNVLGRDTAVEKSLLQLTPDAQSVVLLNSIRTPYSCASDCFQENAVKIVRLNRGHASLVKRLETTQGVCCLLVCEPRFLLAAEEGGKVKLWIMNSEWSGHEEDWYLPMVDCMFPTIVELKTIPKSASLVVGHNGYGEFCLWDIDKRNLVSRFSSPGMSVLECVPASVFRWQTKVEHKMETIVDEIMDATRMQFSERSQVNIVSPENEDVAIWLLISTLSDPDSQYYQPCDQGANTVGCWRLALLINNMVITGSAVDAGLITVQEVTSNSKRARLDCHSTEKLSSVHASTMRESSGSDGIICSSSSCMHEV